MAAHDPVEILAVIETFPDEGFKLGNGLGRISLKKLEHHRPQVGLHDADFGRPGKGGQDDGQADKKDPPGTKDSPHGALLLSVFSCQPAAAD